MIGSSIIVAILATMIYKLVFSFNVLKTLKTLSNGPCALLPGSDEFPGVEDLTFSSDGSYFIGSFDSRQLWMNTGLQGLTKKLESAKIADLRNTPHNDNQGIQGGLLIGLREAGEGEMSVTQLHIPTMGSPDFHPHGISLLEKDGETFILVVNHRASKNGEFLEDSIEVFSLNLQKKTANWKRSFTHPLYRSINDVAAVSADEFYVSNWRYFTAESPFMHLFEVMSTILGLPWTNVVHCNFSRGNKGTTCRISATGLMMANGVLLDSTSENLYVATTIAHEVRQYSINPTSPSTLKLTETYKLNQGVDNLSWSLKNPNELTVAGHPKVFDFQMYAMNVIKASPSQVDTIDVSTGAIKTVFVSKGKPSLNAISVAAIGKDGEMVMGAVLENGVLSCKGH